MILPCRDFPRCVLPGLLPFYGDVMILLCPGSLPIRVFADLGIEADPGAMLTPAQALAFAEHLTHVAIRKQVADRLPDASPTARKVRA